MGDLASKLKAKFKRRNSSTPPSIASSTRSNDRTRSLTGQRPPSFEVTARNRSKKTDKSDVEAVPMTPESESARQSSPLSKVEPEEISETATRKSSATETTATTIATPSDSLRTSPDSTAASTTTKDEHLNEGELKPQAKEDQGAGEETPEKSSGSAGSSAESAPENPPNSKFSEPVASNLADANTKMGKDPQSSALPSINEYPQDSSTTTDSPHTTTDEDDLITHTPSQVVDHSGSGEPTPRAGLGLGIPATANSAQTSAANTNPRPHPSSTHSSPIAARRPNAAFPAPSSSSSSQAGVQAQISAQLLRTLLGSANPDELQNLGGGPLQSLTGPTMTRRRKIWVRRPGASPTLITINEDDMVDDVRDMILRKYANSLGRQFDSPDLTLRIVPRENQRERQLGPDEHMCKTIDAYFPGGQTVDDALIIDVPLRRTPRPSPRAGPPHAPQLASVYFAPASTDDVHRPPEAGTDYFGPAVLATTSHLPNGTSGQPHSIGVLTTGQIPQIPSPGGTRRTTAYTSRPERPRLGRQHTSSPTILNLVNSGHAAQMPAGTVMVEQASGPPPSAPPMPTPPPVEAPAPHVATPPALAPPCVASPRPAARPRKKKPLDGLNLPPGILSGGVPPINVLIVEDNPINLRLLEVFVKRLKVRWQTAVNGREAVDKWRQGGFHLVLMDIQLPVMSGLEATREIRRLERVNSIGVFSSSADSAPDEVLGEPSEEDKLGNTDMFKSPVIIVALTASSLQSDRHEALAAGCNDFLTKPVNFVWFEKKIMEWGCMQALIDFDGWRKWKDFSQNRDEQDAAKKAAAAKAKTKKNRSSLTTAAYNGGTTVAA
ncbi:hypothetical protein MGG_02897 [Pyricularia oryzae 70-15]|uniref:Response regulatory domain-containing protein n=3 Tax=Pyricularia oryzae TaxID=318829 RepID=G5EH08_PYRO7|nr:uncharacterized protein MGG_02897 [Pyricularia oryzae 70-15]EAQ71254.1 hypothetical protein MGCH7_ch7g661 [Pyricularia oryzae 70-15]EHA46085.1 hypothetical protein MGG_02897 [Pyricularia oryzae 70-15]ELQ40214.1 hypothetical protein OOU_Y34scaffold00458g42 [Pyricularia oryzae Y34]KAI7922162.1 hypothetical protein M0657_005782 [Pyricularia oryzae]